MARDFKAPARTFNKNAAAKSLTVKIPEPARLKNFKNFRRIQNSQSKFARNPKMRYCAPMNAQPISANSYLRAEGRRTSPVRNLRPETLSRALEAFENGRLGSAARIFEAILSRDDAICGLTLCPDGVPELEPLPRKVCETPLLQEAEEQLNEYFAGARREFDLPLAPKGTAFQKAVWAEMNKIPYGETRTYGQLAAAVGKPKASRAVGGACHCNPIAILQPCHRVVGSTGKLTGYAYGVEMKQYLLELEK